MLIDFAVRRHISDAKYGCIAIIDNEIEYQLRALDIGHLNQFFLATLALYRFCLQDAFLGPCSLYYESTPRV